MDRCLLYRRLPKRGFTNRNSKEIIAINVDVLNRFEDGAEVTVESLLASSAISKAGDGVKILGNGELTKKLTVKVNAVSETAKSKNRSCRWYSRADLIEVIKCLKLSKNVFRVKEMRRKLLYVLWMILVIRIGSQLPVPGVDSDFFKEWFAKKHW